MTPRATLNNNDQDVLAVLSRRHQAMSAYDILSALNGTAVKAAIQVYRSLNKLVRLGRVHRVETLNAFVACGCAHHGTSPGFFVCSRCGSVTEFDSTPAVSTLASLARGFRVERASVELSGACSACQAREGMAA